MDKIEGLCPASAFFLDDLCAGNVARHQVWRELDAAELQVEHLGKSSNKESLGEAGDPHEQAVPAREQGNEQMLNDRLLSNDGLADFRDEGLIGGP